MSKTFNLFSLFYLLCCGSCLSTQYGENVSSSSDVVFSTQTFITDSIVNACSFFLPKVMGTESIIGSIDRILILDDFVYIVDRKTNVVCSYNITGEFIRSTKNLIGKGQKEYVRIIDATISSDDSLLYVLCDAPYQIIVLNREFEVVNVFPLPGLCTEIGTEGEAVYVIYHDVNNLSSFELRKYNKNLQSPKYDIILKQPNGIVGVSGLGNNLVSDGTQCFFSPPFSNIIYTIRNGNIVEGRNYNFKVRWFNYNEVKMLSGSKFIDQNSDYNWNISNICSSDSIMIFNTNKAGIYKTCLNNGKTYHYISAINTLLPVMSTWIHPVCGVKSCFAMVMSNQQIIKIKKLIQRGELKNDDVSQELKTFLQIYETNDNPIIIFFMMK